MENLATIVDYNADRRPDKTVLTDARGSLTNAELLARVNALAAGLIELGVQRGDRVALVMSNRNEFIEALFAVNRVGAAFLPLNTRLAPAEWNYILRNSQACAVIVDGELSDRVDSLRDALPDLKHLLAIDAAPEGWHSYELLLGSHAGETVPVADVDGSDLQRLMYTSGTTSHPKGVCISHSNVAWKNLALMVEFSLSSDDITAVTGPLYHVGALDMGGLATLHAGGSLVMLPKFDPRALIDLIAEHRATTVWLAPAMVNALLQDETVGAADLSSLRVIMSGGEKMPEARLKQILDLLPAVWFADAYGLTETVSSDTFMPRHAMRDKLGSVGKPVAHQQLRIGDTEGRDVPAGTVGEVLLRGPKVFIGYWADARANEAAFLDGWFRTGDLGHVDEDGFLYIEDRKKDMIVSGGENIASPEVERALYEHPDVLEAAVVAHPDERWGEVPHAFIVVRHGASLSTEDVQEFCVDRLAKFKIPKYVTIVPELPRTATGKVMKRNLRSNSTVQEK